jgi:hypothetical protein
MAWGMERRRPCAYRSDDVYQKIGILSSTISQSNTQADSAFAENTDVLFTYTNQITGSHQTKSGPPLTGS